MTDKPKKRSRWVNGSGVLRYTKPQEVDLRKYRTNKGWHNGARVYVR